MADSRVRPAHRSTAANATSATTISAISASDWGGAASNISSATKAWPIGNLLMSALLWVGSIPLGSSDVQGEPTPRSCGGRVIARLIRCPRCGSPVLSRDVEHGAATCGTCGLTWPYLGDDDAQEAS